MSSYIRKTKHPETGEWLDAYWLDDYFGPHHYGVQFKGGDVFDPEKVTLETNDEPTAESWGWDVTDAEEKAAEKRDIDRPHVLEYQLAAVNWLIGRCEDQFVRAWLVQEREALDRAGSTPEYY